MKRELRPLAVEKNECWSMDFILDELFDGRRIRLLTIVDNHTRESLAIHVGQRIRGCEVVEVLERVMKDHGRPRTIRVDNVLRPHSALGNATPEEYAAQVEPRKGLPDLDLEAVKNGLAYSKSC
jgi:transposase InsO family protein